MLNALTVLNVHPDLTDYYVAILIRNYVDRLAGGVSALNHHQTR